MNNNRVFINMNDGRVVGYTDEIVNNINYREIDMSVAIAIRDGKVTPQYVIAEVQKQVGVIPFSEMMSAVAKLNVRTTDLNLESKARGESAGGEAKPYKIGIPESAPAQNASAPSAAVAAVLSEPEAPEPPKEEPSHQKTEPEAPEPPKKGAKVSVKF